MPRRNSPNDIQDLSDLSRMGDIVVDKRLGQRASAKKSRRNQHYEKQFIRNTLMHPPPANRPDADFGEDEKHIGAIATEQSAKAEASVIPGCGSGSQPVTVTEAMRAPRLNPKKLLLSKWTAVNPKQREKHFIVTALLQNDECLDKPQPIVDVVIEAVHSGRATTVPWRELTVTALWLQGWR